MIIRQGDFIFEVPPGCAIEFVGTFNGSFKITEPGTATSVAEALVINERFRKPVVSVVDEAARAEQAEKRFQRLSFSDDGKSWPAPTVDDFVDAIRIMPKQYDFNVFIALQFVLGLLNRNPVAPEIVWKLMSSSKFALCHEPKDMPRIRDQLEGMRSDKPEEARLLEEAWKKDALRRDKYRQRMLRLLAAAVTIFNRDLDEHQDRHYCEVQRILLGETRERYNDSPYLDDTNVTYRKEPVPVKGPMPRAPPPPPTRDPEDI
jgi:hypothetical protein